MKKQDTIVVAMSGGVDSSAAVALLDEAGFNVIGMMLRLWSESGKEVANRCCSPESMGLARRVAGQLGIPFYVLDVQEAFRTTVVEHFFDGYAQNLTPNPCLVCNRHIRWGILLQHARALGANLLATGHYARVRKSPNGHYQLLRAHDAAKDQSYALSVLNQDQLAHTRFPLGTLTKHEVRELTRRFGLPVADRPDSQDLCFLAGEDYRSFLRRNHPQVAQPGPIVNRQGERLGEHGGLAFFTIGQRKGLGISAPTPLYVLEKDAHQNTLIVGDSSELGRDRLTAVEVNWIAGTPPERPFRGEVKIRSTARYASATITPLGEDAAQVRFDTLRRDITPGQAAVFYQSDVCLGGGIITPESI